MIIILHLILVLQGALALPSEKDRFLGFFETPTTTTTTTTTTTPAPTTTTKKSGLIDSIGGLIFGTTTLPPPTTPAPATTTKAPGLIDNIGGLIFGTTTTLPPTTTTAAQQSMINNILGMFGLGGGSTSTSTTPAPSGVFDAILGLVTGNQTPVAPSTNILTSITNVMTGVSSTLPITEIAAMLGVPAKPVPSPFSDPLGFLMHPLVTPVIMAALTLNLPALLVAKAHLAGSLVLQKLLF